MKNLIVNKKSLMVASILLILVMIAAGFWQYRSTPQVKAEGVLSIDIGQNGSYAPPAKVSADKQPEDPHTRELLLQQGIDPEYTELVQDYGKPLTASEKAAKQAIGDKSPDPSPYGRTYRDKVSGKYILETQGLPMVDADGNPVIPQWEQVDKDYQARNNLFTLQVVDASGNIMLTVKNDQPDGRKANDVLAFNPELYVGTTNVTQEADASPTLLAVDPMNPNYTNNVLEWDFGTVKRWMRLIEGQYQGYWLRPVSLDQEMRVVYNQTGDFKLRLGQFGVDADTEVVPTVITQPQFLTTITYQGIDYYLISDQLPFYPDTDVESTSVDGDVRRITTNEDWADIRSGAGTTPLGDANINMYALISSGTTSDKWRWLTRGIMLFDTSSLPPNATIVAATISLYVQSKSMEVSRPDFAINIFSSSPASNTVLVANDYSAVGSTAFATAIAYNSITTSAYNEFTLNASGRAAISLSGVSKFSVRESYYDAAGNTPPWVGGGADSGVTFFTADRGTDYRPKLVVTYSTDIYNSPSSTNFEGAHLAPNTTVETQNGRNFFTVTNYSGSAVNISISGTDIGNWTLSDTWGPEDTAVLKAGLSSSGSYNVVVTGTPSLLIYDPPLANNASQNWGLQLRTPQSYSSNANKTGTVTLTATTP